MSSREIRYPPPPPVTDTVSPVSFAVTSTVAADVGGATFALRRRKTTTPLIYKCDLNLLPKKAHRKRASGTTQESSSGEISGDPGG